MRGYNFFYFFERLRYLLLPGERLFARYDLLRFFSFRLLLEALRLRREVEIIHPVFAQARRRAVMGSATVLERALRLQGATAAARARIFNLRKFYCLRLRRRCCCFCLHRLEQIPRLLVLLCHHCSPSSYTETPSAPLAYA